MKSNIEYTSVLAQADGESGGIGFDNGIIFSYNFYEGKNYIYWDYNKNVVEKIGDENLINNHLFKISDAEFVSVGFVYENENEGKIKLTIFESIS